MRPAVILAILILLLTPALVRMVMGPPAPEHIEETRQDAVPL
ncbi:hypothetical protein [Geminicoccus roseus]|jgi:hypothetical protein|nr:hypothetical protein [Geminicoccus roseus]